MTTGSVPPWQTGGSSLTESLTARTNLDRLKRRIYRIGLTLVSISLLFSMWLVLKNTTNYPSAVPYIVTSSVILLAGLVGLIALRDLKNVRPVEIALCIAALFYQAYWDVLALLSRELPRPEYQMTSSATFLLAAAFLCIVVPRRHLPITLALAFGTHELLTWATLLKFPWGQLHSSQLMNDLTMLVTMLFLSLIGAYQHVTVLAQQEGEMMQRLGVLDPLTGLANRRALYGELKRFQHGAVLYFDLDDFKQLNEQHGHLAGDAALAQAAGVLRELFGTGTHVGRWGGKEFLVLLGSTTSERALSLAEDARTRIQQAGQHNGLPMTVSISVATLKPAETATQAAQRAENNLDATKGNQKNHVNNAD